MIRLHNALCALGAALILAGCGGGGSTALGGAPGGGGGAGRAPAITGTVGVTGTTAFALGFGRAPGDTIEPLTNAAVELHRVDPTNPTAADPNPRSFTTTDGTFVFFSDEVTLGHAYRVEAMGQVQGASVRFESLVTVPSGANWSQPIRLDVTEATTVAARVVEQQILDLMRDNLSLDELGDLQSQIRLYVDALEDEPDSTPNFHDPAWDQTLSEDLTSAVEPTGGFVGAYGLGSATKGRLGALVVPDYEDPNGPQEFLIFAVPTGVEAVTFTSPSEPPAIPDDEDMEILSGTVNAGGHVWAQSDDRAFVVTGTLIGNTGSGTWTYLNPVSGVTERGTWSVRQVQPPFGPYGGVIFDKDGNEGHIAGLYADDGRAFFRAEFGSGTSTTWVAAAGAVGPGGAWAFSWYDSTGARGSGEGQFETLGAAATVFGIFNDPDGNEVWMFDATNDNPFPNGLPRG